MDKDFENVHFMLGQQDASSWIIWDQVPKGFNLAEDYREALSLVPPHAWYAEQIGWQNRWGSEEWWEAAARAWIQRKMLDDFLKNPLATPEISIQFNRKIQTEYPFIGADSQPMRVRLGTSLWMQPYSTDPENAPDPSICLDGVEFLRDGRENSNVDFSDSDSEEDSKQIESNSHHPTNPPERWQFLVGPFDGELVGVLRQWVPECFSARLKKPLELWQELESGRLKERWEPFIIQQKALIATEDFPHWKKQDIGYFVGQLVAAALPYDLHTAAYAHLRILGHEVESIPLNLRATFGGVVETAIVRQADSERSLGIALPHAYNAGHESRWFTKVGGVLTRHAEWISNESFSSIRERVAREDGRLSVDMREKSEKSKALHKRYERFKQGKLTKQQWCAEQYDEACHKYQEVLKEPNIKRSAPRMPQLSNIKKAVDEYIRLRKKEISQTPE